MENYSREEDRKSWREGLEKSVHLSCPAELIGGRVMRPYVPLGIERIDEGRWRGGDTKSSSVNSRLLYCMGQNLIKIYKIDTPLRK